MTPVDLERLIQIIVEELAAAGAGRAPVRCGCHSVLYECCPSRVAPVVEAGATRLGLHAVGGGAGSVAGMIDHTLLKPDATKAEIETLCREASEFGFASVCVNPTWVATCARLAEGERRRGVFGRRVPARGDDGGHEAVRDAAGDLRRRARDRHGHQRRRAEVGRSAPGRAGHRGRDVGRAARRMS